MSTKWSSEIKFPKDSDYILRVTKAEFGESKSSGNPMITLYHEVVAPETKTVDGEDVEVAGVSVGLKTYHTVISKLEDGSVDVVKTQKNNDRLKKLFEEQYGVSFAYFNPENPNLEGFLGKEVYALIDDEATEKRKAPTKEQLAKGIRQGDVLLHPATKKPLIDHYPKIKEVFCPVPKTGAGL